MSSTATDEILRRRARELARPLEATADTDAALAVMRFRLGDQGYVVPLVAIRQVVPLAGAARLPRAAWPLVALAPVAGQIVPVVALARSTAGAGLRAGTPWAVAVAVGSTVVCLPADEVTGLVDLRDGDVTAHGEGERHTRGLTREGDIVLDVDALLPSSVGDPGEHGRTGAAGPEDDA